MDELNIEWRNAEVNSSSLISAAGVYFWETSLGHCKREYSYEVFKDNCTKDFFIPSAFSPNDDGINDLFTIYSNNQIMVKSLRIFDRWGNYLYKGENIIPGSEGWDGKLKGKPLGIGVYIWVAEVELPDGEMTIEKGDLTLFR